MTLDFTDRHIVVTGGTGALGSTVVRLLLGAGASCSVTCVDGAELNRSGLGREERVHVATGIDLTDEKTVERFYADAVGTTGRGRLWASIHIAGGFSMGPIESTTKEQFVHMMQMNALTCFLCCREAVKRMGGSGGGGGDTGGRIVNVAARPALEPRQGAQMIPYTASKAAVAAITQALAEEVAGRGILVNAVVPSIMDTPANRKSMPDADHSKWPKLDEVAATVAFLASPQNAVTRGGLVPVYGRS